MNIKALIIVSSFVLLTGCASLLTSGQKVDQFYMLNTATDVPPELGPFEHTIVIEKIELAQGLDSDKIMLKKNDQQMDFYARARWSTPLSHMIQMNLVEAFENSEVLSQVATEHAAVNADYALVVDVYAFQAEYDELDEPPTVHIKMTAKLLSLPARQMVASFTIDAREKATENSLGPIVSAFDDAFQGTQIMLITELLDYFSYQYYMGH